MKKNIKTNMIKKVYLMVLTILMLFTIIGCANDTCDGIHHTESDWIIVSESNCTTEGLRQKVCTKCGAVLEEEAIPTTGHTVVVDEAVAATCTETGLTEGSHCSVCDEIIVAQEEIPALGHNYVLDETLSNSEYLVYVCTRCNDKYQVENTTGELCQDGHTASEWIITKEATCTEEGSRHKVCTVCGVELEIEDIPVIAHTIVIDEAVAATCTETGLTEGSHCSVCDEVIVAQKEIPALGHTYVLTSTKQATLDEEGYLEYTCSVCGDVYREVLAKLTDYNSSDPTVITLSDAGSVITNNNGGVLIDKSTITITLAGEYTFTGTLSEGNIVVTLGEEDDITINLEGVSLSCSTTDPIYVSTGDKVEISAKSGTKNYIYDKRTLASSEDATGAAIYSEIDLELKGKGELYIETAYNNGIGSKDDVTIKNLTLEVKACNNAIKGNDSLTIESGTITAISTGGDALKTENSDISDKGNQRGIITIESGTINLYAACDGIDASYDAIISGGTINIFTESYSTYSGEVTVTSSSEMYLRISSRTNVYTTSLYSAMFIAEDGTTTWKNLTYTPSGQTRYYVCDVPNGAKYVKFYAYSSGQTQGQSTTYAYVTDQLTIPTTYDTYYVSSSTSSTKSMSGSWTNYATNQQGGGMGGGMGGMGGMQDGNSNSATYSCKGIKADNTITISGGTINIKAHDDAIHTNSDTLLETSVYGAGNVTITGGDITVYSDDDGLHADGTLSIEGGNIVVTNSYEALEGNYIYLKDGVSQITSSDDGINAKTALYISGGVLYLNANGDGIDSNGTVSMTGGVVLATGPTNGGNGVIDYQRSFSFSGGLLLAIGASGMNQKPTASSGNTSTSKSISTNTSSYVVVSSGGSVVAVLKVTKSSQNYCVLAYNNATYPSASATVTTTNSYTLVNNLYYVAGN